MPKDKEISIIIPIRRNEDISRVISSIKTQNIYNPEKHEIIIVDENKERSTQRNIGISKASGKYIAIVDSDQLFEQGLLADILQKMDSGYDALYVKERIIGTNWFDKVRNWERQFYTGTAVDCVRIVKKNICPIFNEQLTGPEDADFDRRIAGKKGVTDKFFLHDDSIGIIKYFQKKAYYAKSMGLYRAFYPKDKVLNPFWRCFGVFFENKKWKLVIKNPIFFICVMGIILIRGVIYAKTFCNNHN